MNDRFRHYSFFDKFCLNVDLALRALSDNPKTTGAMYPAKNTAEESLSDEQQKLSAALMRINHSGEICAQALYHGQGIVSKSNTLSAKLQHAAEEEGDHLAWCKMRLHELNSRTSYLNPLWYTGSFCIGVVAGTIGDAWSLGFLVETERQVIKHLESHLQSLPKEDARSFTILKQMEQDEAKHRDEAIASGARELPKIIKKVMHFTSKIMVKTAFWV